SGVNGVVANVNVQAVNTSYVYLRGNVIDLKQGLSAPLGLVSFIQTASSNVEVLDMTKPGNGPVAGRLRLDAAMLKGVGDTSNGLAIGNDATNRNSTLTFQDPLLLNSGAGAAAGRVVLQSGGPIIFNAPVDAGIKTVTIRVADIQFGPGIAATQVMSKNGLVVSPSGGGAGLGSTRDLEVYSGARRAYDPAQNVLNLHVDDLDAFAGNFTGTLTLGREDAEIGGNLRINAPINLAGKLTSGLTLIAPENLLVNQPITLGAVGSTTAKQGLILIGREVALNAAITGTGNLWIRPVNVTRQSNDLVTYPGGNPLNRGMLIGTGVADPDNANHLTITDEEYGRISNTFSRIVFGRDAMGGDLEIRGSALGLKADTELQAASAAKLYSTINGGGKFLWVRALELDVDNQLTAAPKSLTNLSALWINTLSSAQTPPLQRKIVVNGLTDQGPLSLDLTRQDLSWIDGTSVPSVVIGYDGFTYNYSTAATSNLPIEVVGDASTPWTLPANTELRSSNRIYAAGVSLPPVYGSIVINAPVDGAGYNLTLRSDSRLELKGGAGSVTNVGTLRIEQHKLDVPIRLLDPDTYVNADALVFGRSSYAALGAGIGNLFVGRANSKSDLTVSGPMTLVANTTLTTGYYAYNAGVPSQPAGTGQLLRIDAPIDGDKALTLASYGGTQVAASLGATTPLASLSITKNTDIAGTTQRTEIGAVGGPAVAVRTSGNQTYSEAVLLNSSGTLESGGTLTVSGTLSAGANDLALLANEMTFSGGVGSIAGTGGLTLGAGRPETNMAFFGTTSVAGQLNLTQAKLQAIALTGFNKLTVGRSDSTGTLSVKENFTLLQETVFQTGGSALNIEKQINGAKRLTLNAGTGNILVSGALGSSAPVGELSVLSSGTATFQGAVNAASLWSDAGGSLVLNGGSVSTSGGQTYNDPLVLGGTATLSSSGAGDILLNGGASGTGVLNVNTSGITRLQGGIQVGSLTTNPGGTVEMAGAIQTSGGQSYGEAVRLLADTALTGSTVSFGNTLAGETHSLTVTGNAVFGGAATGLDTVSVSGTTALNGGAVTSTGTQTYTGAVTLGADAALTGSTVSFGNTLAGGSNSLAVTGNAVLGGAATGLNTVSVSGTTALNGGVVSSTGTKTYSGAVTLGADTALTGSTVSFGNTLAGGTNSL
ncbi:MAG: hypothetical protein RLZZ253_2719, partial [Verrucomicrobiota bacterium]